MYHIHYLLKFTISAIINLPSNIKSVRNMSLKSVLLLGYIFCGLSLYLSLSHRNIHRPYNFPDIYTVISHILNNKHILKSINMLLFTLPNTTDINIVSLHETAKLLLRYTLSNHSRLTQIRS
jgi:hypothetical protein